MQPQDYVGQLEASRAFFAKSTATLTEADSGFAPKEGMMTVAQHVTHVAHTIAWFAEGAFRPEGFDLDFEKFERHTAAASSLEEARADLARAYDQAIEAVGSKSAEELASPLPEGEIMGGKPRSVIVNGIEDHTAHHRGALTVYARLLGRVPAMPYEP